MREFCSERTCGRILTLEELVGEFCTNLYNFRRTAFARAILIFSASRIRNHDNFPDFLLKMSQTPIKIHLCRRENLWKNFWGGRTCERILQWKNLWENFDRGRTCERILQWKNLWENFDRGRTSGRILYKFVQLSTNRIRVRDPDIFCFQNQESCQFF